MSGEIMGAATGLIATGIALKATKGLVDAGRKKRKKRKGGY